MQPGNLATDASSTLAPGKVTMTYFLLYLNIAAWTYCKDIFMIQLVEIMKYKLIMQTEHG